MVEPQSTALFVLLVVIFGALMRWMLITSRSAVRFLAACLAFALATLFGMMAVNKYYGYYPTWGAAFGDLASQGTKGVDSAPPVPGRGLPSRSHPGPPDSRQMAAGQARQQGYTLRMAMTGQLSRITRMVYVYLPPQYFQSSYQTYRFPVVELIHGQPGEPQDWITVLGVTRMLGHLLAEHLAQPAVLVMPDADGGKDVSLQCLNQFGGPQDLTYLAVDLPDQIARIVRVQPPGPAWGVAGYSEGGFCAANMALQFRYRYGFAGVLSGYFTPFDNQLARPIRLVSPFGGSRRRQRDNTPLDEVRALPAGAVMPRFWLGAGAADTLDVTEAEVFWQELQLRQADVPLTLTPGGGHSMATWQAEVPPMLRWMTQGVARAAASPGAAGPGRRGPGQ